MHLHCKLYSYCTVTCFKKFVTYQPSHVHKSQASVCTRTLLGNLRWWFLSYKLRLCTADEIRLSDEHNRTGNSVQKLPKDMLLGERRFELIERSNSVRVTVIWVFSYESTYFHCSTFPRSPPHTRCIHPFQRIVHSPWNKSQRHYSHPYNAFHRALLEVNSKSIIIIIISLSKLRMALR